MFLKTTINCHKASRLISLSQDYPLEFSQRVLLKIHLMRCAGCVRFAQQITALRRLLALRRQKEETPLASYPHSLSPECQGRIQSLLRKGKTGEGLIGP